MQKGANVFLLDGISVIQCKAMSLNAYTPILIQFLLAFSIGVVILIASALLGQRSKSTAIKDAPYECGLISEGKPHPRFSVKFYITAMLFILFDIEIVFFIPWVLVYRELIANAVAILAPTFFFIALMALGLLYELRKGALEWTSER
jgi:NADH-quinone oxidoreductase subunit A